MNLFMSTQSRDIRGWAATLSCRPSNNASKYQIDSAGPEPPPDQSIQVTALPSPKHTASWEKKKKRMGKGARSRRDTANMRQNDTLSTLSMAYFDAVSPSGDVRGVGDPSDVLPVSGVTQRVTLTWMRSLPFLYLWIF